MYWCPASLNLVVAAIEKIVKMSFSQIAARSRRLLISRTPGLPPSGHGLIELFPNVLKELRHFVRRMERRMNGQIETARHRRRCKH